MTNAGSNVYRNIHVFLLVEPSEIQVVAVFPKYGMYWVEESELIFKKTFNSKKEAEAYLSKEGVSYKECRLEGASVFIDVVPKGYDRESEYGTIYRSKLIANYREDEPKFKNRKEAHIHYLKGDMRASLQVDTKHSFTHHYELEKYLNEVRQRFPDLGVREDKLEHPMKDRLLTYFALAFGLVALGFFIGNR